MTAKPGTEGAGAPPASQVEFLSPPQDSAFPDEWYGMTAPDHFWFQWRLEATLRQVLHVGVHLDRPLRVLDVGGGTGVLRDQLEARTDWVIDITDLNANALLRSRRGRGRTLCYDVLVEAPPLLEAYDLVLLFDVLEHIQGTGPFVRAVLKHLKPGGRLLMNVPACQSLFSAYDIAAGHVRRYEPASLAAEFEGTGLEIEDIRYWGLLLVPVLFARKLILGASAVPGVTLRHGFQPPGRLVHGLLRALLRTETAILHRPPLGSSLLLVGRRRPGTVTG